MIFTNVLQVVKFFFLKISVADPGFPVGGGVHPLGGHGPLMRALFSENVCETERIGSHRGWRAPGTPPLRSANEYHDT